MLIALKITFIKRSSNDFFSYSESRNFDKFRSAAHQHVSADIWLRMASLLNWPTA